MASIEAYFFVVSILPFDSIVLVLEGRCLQPGPVGATAHGLDPSVDNGGKVRSDYTDAVGLQLFLEAILCFVVESIIFLLHHLHPFHVDDD